MRDAVATWMECAVARWLECEGCSRECESAVARWECEGCSS